ncbi:Crp/Fnr family transcriptional regulator [Nostocoides sp. F2B08]|uniref:Crp/Fnr family transcriptional regulator n=1 Tax=Nostocoides sp. F2B08 TaxID=2653936 RepID=UPI00186AEB71|nr:Crp/Fnr family transcriptional regulator [Tetrasphaera sp. F2B08]
MPLFAGLTREQQAEVATLARPVTVGPGETFVRAGAREAPLFVVHAGMVKLSRTTADGKSTTVQVLGPGEVGGETWLLTGERPENDVVALEGARICVFEPSALDRIVREFPAVGVALLRSLAVRLHSAERMLTARTLADVGARLAAYLLDCPTTWGVDRAATAHLPMAKKDIATFLGTSPETVSRRLKAFEHEGLIQVRGMDIDIWDPVGLELRARGA